MKFNFKIVFLLSLLIMISSIPFAYVQELSFIINKITKKEKNLSQILELTGDGSKSLGKLCFGTYLGKRIPGDETVCQCYIYYLMKSENHNFNKAQFFSVPAIYQNENSLLCIIDSFPYKEQMIQVFLKNEISGEISNYIQTNKKSIQTPEWIKKIKNVFIYSSL
jgi:hypothetical protein